MPFIRDFECGITIPGSIEPPLKHTEIGGMLDITQDKGEPITDIG
jgi:hypothetical protein